MKQADKNPDPDSGGAKIDQQLVYFHPAPRMTQLGI